MRVKSHQLPITMRMAMEFTEDSPPGRSGAEVGSAALRLPPGPALGGEPPLCWAGDQGGCQPGWRRGSPGKSLRHRLGEDGGPEGTEEPGLSFSWRDSCQCTKDKALHPTLPGSRLRSLSEDVGRHLAEGRPGPSRSHGPAWGTLQT